MKRAYAELVRERDRPRVRKTPSPTFLAVLDALARLDHPEYEVIVIIGHDDPETEFVAREAAARCPRIVRVVMDYHLPKNKPKALNTALRKCRGDIVGVFDAEDEVHPGLLRLVEARFEESGADVV